MGEKILLWTLPFHSCDEKVYYYFNETKASRKLPPARDLLEKGRMKRLYLLFFSSSKANKTLFARSAVKTRIKYRYYYW